MRTTGRFRFDDVMTIMRQLLHALAYSHRRGVIHRDIKPANVMVQGDLQIKVMDFGIARIQSSSMTQFGTVLGTPTHMAPEALMGNTADARADVWSAGVMLYELLSGINPFAADTPAGVMHRVMQVDPPTLVGEVPDLPLGVDAVVACALAKDPVHRFQSADEFLEALTMAAQDQVVAAWSPTLPHLDLNLPDTPTQPMPHAPVHEAASSAAGHAPLELPPLTLAIVESALEPSLGSLAKHLVRSCVKHVSNRADFYSTLASYIPDPAECDEFLKNVNRLERMDPARHGPAGAAPAGATQRSRSGAFDAQTLDRAERQLTHHVGPLARALINRAVSDSGNVGELYRKLAEHIPSEPARRAFLDALR
jgi:serine/threonine-protein kinase